MGNCMPTLDQPNSKKSYQSNHCFDCAVSAKRGQRRTMEDANVISLSLPKHPSYSLIGVFDGFNGPDASTYLSENIVKALDAVHYLEDNDAIIDAINQMDDDYIHSKQETLDDNTVPNVNAGSTYVLALINTANSSPKISSSSIELATSSRPSLVPVLTSTGCSVDLAQSITSSIEYEFASSTDYSEEEMQLNSGSKVRIFWAGDSRAMLMSNDCLFQDLTFDHHCSVKEESDRINNAEGVIKNGRIDGICEVTRGFGCYMMKNNVDLASNKQKMIPEAAIRSLVCNQDDILVLFCDGLNKKWTDKQLKERIKHHALEQENEKKGLLYSVKYLVEQAMDEGSKDNITLIAVKFK